MLRAWVPEPDTDRQRFLAGAGFTADGAARVLDASVTGRRRCATALVRRDRPVTSDAAALAPARRGAVAAARPVVGAATGLYGISFGALSVAAGVGLWPTMALSLLMFTGGSQFAFVGVVAAGGGPLAAVATSTLLGVRNGLYGLQVAQWLGAHGARRVAAAQLTIDESFAVGSAQPEPAARRLGFWTTGVAVFVCWNVMTGVGALIGDRLGDPRRYGLDAMAAAAFLALLWPRLTTARTARRRRPGRGPGDRLCTRAARGAADPGRRAGGRRRGAGPAPAAPADRAARHRDGPAVSAGPPRSRCWWPVPCASPQAVRLQRAVPPAVRDRCRRGR